MNGKAILKLRKPEKDNPQNLYSENYDVLHYEYAFEKKITKTGKINSDVLAGNIRVLLPMFPSDSLLSWTFDKQKKINGEITINDAYEESLERIYFEDARCVGLRLHYEPGDNNHNVVLLLTINAQRMIIGEVEYQNPWK